MNYQLTLVNNSTRPGNLVIFQKLGSSPNSLAWVSKYAYPNTQFNFEWDSNSYSFVWAGTGQLSPGIVFTAAQVQPANPAQSNQIDLSYDQAHKVFFFRNQTTGRQAGSFTIQQDQTIPANAAAVGIGMAGKAIVAVQCMPNMTLTFEVRTEYWVTFGDIVQGSILGDLDSLNAVRIDFPPNVNAMTATLNADDSWTVESNILARTAPDQE